MIHIRIDNEIENSKRQFACGIGPDLPAGAGTADPVLAEWRSALGADRAFCVFKISLEERDLIFRRL